ncbi:MAG: hypothetical protein EZS28_043439, partial [Streblomastix strix]
RGKICGFMKSGGPSLLPKEIQILIRLAIVRAKETHIFLYQLVRDDHQRRKKEGII